MAQPKSPLSRAERQSLYRAKNLEADRERSTANYRRLRQEDPVALLLKGAKDRSRIKGLSCTITREDIDIPDVCPILGIPIVINVLGNDGGKRDSSPRLDRVHPERGYVPGNVRVISNKANRLKADNTVETLWAILTYIHGVN